MVDFPETHNWRTEQKGETARTVLVLRGPKMADREGATTRFEEGLGGERDFQEVSVCYFNLYPPQVCFWSYLSVSGQTNGIQPTIESPNVLTRQVVIASKL